MSNAIRIGYWSILMMNRQAEWVRVASYKSEWESKARKEYKLQPRGYAYRLYNPEGELVDSKGDASYIVMG